MSNPTYSYWVVEVNHDTGKAVVDHDATQFWINRIFMPESNVMRFNTNAEGYDERETLAIDFDELNSEWEHGLSIIDKALSKK
jgi:hypothetical protein